MAIKREQRPESNFYTLNKSISEDESLSWAARGLLIFLLGKPDHWVISTQHLINQTASARIASGRDAVRGLINELVDAGYVRRDLTQLENGKFSGFDYVVSEKKTKPETANPSPVQPSTADHPLVSTEYLTKTEPLVNKGKPSKAVVVKKPEGVDDQTWADWLQHRKEIKAAVTETVLKAFSKEAAKAGISLSEAFEESCAQGWRGFKAAWHQRSNAGSQQKLPMRQPMKTFDQQRREEGWAAWEHRNGRTHPDRLAAQAPQQGVIDITPRSDSLYLG